jgi:hypothetical protein
MKNRDDSAAFAASGRTRFYDFWSREKSPKASVLKAESSHRWHSSINFPKELLFLGILGIPEPQRPDGALLVSL